MEALETPLDATEASSLFWAFVLIFAMSGVVFSGVWLISTALAIPSP